MKTYAILLLALLIPALLPAATIAQFDAWKETFPAASPNASPKLQQTIAGYQQLVRPVTPLTAKKTLVILRQKMARDQMTADHALHPTKTTPPVTPAMRSEAEALTKWLTEKLAPFLAKAP